MVRRTLAFLLVLAVAGCGGGGEDDPGDEPPAAATIEGGFSVAGTIVRNTFDKKLEGEEADARPMALTCADDACESVLQRVGGSGDSNSRTWTVRLQRDGDTWTGTDARSGACVSGKGKYAESVTWTWEQTDDGLTGETRQVFKGCGEDGVAVTEAVATRESDDPDEYSGESSVDVVDALANYNAAASEAHDGWNGCIERDAAGDCYVPIVEKWSESTDELAGALEVAASRAAGQCAQALRKSPLARFADRLAGLARPDTSTDERNPVAESTSKVYLWLTVVTRWCVPADLIGGMTESPEYDVNEALPVKEAR